MRVTFVPQLKELCFTEQVLCSPRQDGQWVFAFRFAPM